MFKVIGEAYLKPSRGVTAPQTVQTVPFDVERDPDALSIAVLVCSSLVISEMRKRGYHATEYTIKLDVESSN